MTRTPDQIARRILTTQRTRWEGQEPRDDETLALAYEAMKRRAEDAELILLWLTKDNRQLRRHETVGGSWYSLDDLDAQQVLVCAADGTGLPILTDEARAALRGDRAATPGSGT